MLPIQLRSELEDIQIVSPMHGPEDSLPSDAQSNVLSSEVFSRDSERCLDGRIERLSEFPSAVGGQADIYEGLLGNQKVAIKIRRFFQRSVHFENTSSKVRLL